MEVKSVSRRLMGDIGLGDNFYKDRLCGKLRVDG